MCSKSELDKFGYSCFHSDSNFFNKYSINRVAAVSCRGYTLILLEKPFEIVGIDTLILAMQRKVAYRSNAMT